MISAQIDIQINTNYTSQLTCLLAKFPSIFASQARPAKTSENNETEFYPPLLSCASMKCPPALQRAPGWDFQAAQGTGRTLGSLASPHLFSSPLSAQPFKHNSSNSLWVAPLSVHLWTKIKKRSRAMVQCLAGFSSYSGIHSSLNCSEGWGQLLTLISARKEPQKFSLAQR